MNTDIISSGCCRPAGSFGFESGHWNVSQALCERELFPAVRRKDENTPRHYRTILIPDPGRPGHSSRRTAFSGSAEAGAGTQGANDINPHESSIVQPTTGNTPWQALRGLFLSGDDINDFVKLAE
ncbi:hypothetical protein AB0268_12580 [Pseudarthrobacter oxydans]|uniref:hypothetical protein n=1 Tax=Pseudarthrobacter oxydans TaxID=1671 RepID=UPI003450A591